MILAYSGYFAAASSPKSSFSVERFTHVLCEVFGHVGLGEGIHSGVDDAVMHDRVLRAPEV
jgi:hypothetical protein